MYSIHDTPFSGRSKAVSAESVEPCTNSTMRSPGNRDSEAGRLLRTESSMPGSAEGTMNSSVTRACSCNTVAQPPSHNGRARNSNGASLDMNVAPWLAILGVAHVLVEQRITAFRGDAEGAGTIRPGEAEGAKLGGDIHWDGRRVALRVGGVPQLPQPVEILRRQVRIHAYNNLPDADPNRQGGVPPLRARLRRAVRPHPTAGPQGCRQGARLPAGRARARGRRG